MSNKHAKRYSTSSVIRKNANYKETVHSYQSDHFGDNLELSSKVGDAHTLPTYCRLSPPGSHEKISPTDNDSSDYFLNPPKDGLKLKNSGVLVNV